MQRCLVALHLTAPDPDEVFTLEYDLLCPVALKHSAGAILSLLALYQTCIMFSFSRVGIDIPWHLASQGYCC